MTFTYISGKITGLSEEEASKMFLQAERELCAHGHDPMNPMKLPHNHGKTWQEYMKEDLRAMLTCEYIYMLKNWKESKGATIEHNLAKELGIKIIYQ